MNNPMRLFNRKGVWHVEFAGGKRRSLRTSDEKTARGIFRELEKDYLRGRLLRLDNTKRISISEFSTSNQLKLSSFLPVFSDKSRTLLQPLQRLGLKNSAGGNNP